MKRWFLKILCGAVLSVLVPSCGGGLLTTVSNRQRDQATSARVIYLVNQERAKRGLQQVRSEEGLRRMAEQHVLDLAASVDPTRGKPSSAMAHKGFKERSDVALAQGYRVISEVVMIGYAGNLNAVAERTLRGWVRSSSHRAAILQGDRRIIGVSTRILKDGRYFVTGLMSNGRVR